MLHHNSKRQVRLNGTSPKYTPAQYDSAAESHGGRCVKYPRVCNEHGVFQCARGHTFRRSGAAIMVTHSWCPQCTHLRGIHVKPEGGRVKLFDLMGIE